MSAEFFVMSAENFVMSLKFFGLRNCSARPRSLARWSIILRLPISWAKAESMLVDIQAYRITSNKAHMLHLCIDICIVGSVSPYQYVPRC